MRRSRKMFLIAAVPLFCLFFCSAPGERPLRAATLAGEEPPPTARPEGPLLADRDGNGISDGLQQKLSDLAPDDLVDVVVTFEERGDADLARRAIGPFRIKRELDLIPGFAAAASASQVRALSKARGVFRVEEDFRVEAMLDAARPAFGIEAIEKSGAGLSGYGIGVCIVDTGIDPEHEQLDGFDPGNFIDYVGAQQYPYDDHGHGTHVAAIVAGDGSGGNLAGAYHGVAPAAVLYAAKVLDSTGSGYDSDVEAGLAWCANQPGVRIISMSLGSGGSSDGGDALSLAVDAAVSDHGKIVVVAAGNSGDGDYTIGSPAAALEAVTVGAAAEHSSAGKGHHSEGIYLAPFSSRGPTADGRIKPDIVAPGHSIMAADAGTVNGYVVMSGTSMATPFVSGTLALALEANPGLSPGELKDLAASTARDRGEAGFDIDWGSGLLDGVRLIAAAGSITADATPFPSYQRSRLQVPDNQVTTFDFTVADSDLGVPLAVMITILEGGAVCLYGDPLYCDLLGGWAWAPDLDAELVHPTKGVVASSECPLYGECGSMGRQETLHYFPSSAEDIGTYTVRIWPFADDADGGKGSEVSIDLSRAPLDGGDVNTPPVADDQSVTVAVNASVEITLTASDADGDPLTYSVEEPPAHGSLSGTPPLLTYAPHADYTGPDAFTFTAHDGIAASAPAAVSIEVAAANAAPTVKIVEPRDGDLFESGSKITFSGSAADPEDGDLTAGLRWSSNLDGYIGSGGSFTLRGNKKLSDGVHTVTAEVADSQGAVGSMAIQVTVGGTDGSPTPPEGAMHVSSLAGGGEIVNSKFWKATVIATVQDASGASVANATVTGDWSGAFSGSDSCLTDSSGSCGMNTRNLKYDAGSVTFTVTGVTHESMSYDESANDTTSIEIAPPQ